MCFLAKISLLRPPRLHAWHSTHRQSRSHFALSSLSDQWEIRLFFTFRNTFWHKITASFTIVIKRSPGGLWICRWLAVNLEIHLWSSGVTTFGDRPASSMSKFSASVNYDLWVWSHQLTSDLRDVYFLDMHTCLAMIVSESSFGVYVCLSRPAGLHRNQRSCRTAQMMYFFIIFYYLINIYKEKKKREKLWWEKKEIVWSSIDLLKLIISVLTWFGTPALTERERGSSDSRFLKSTSSLKTTSYGATGAGAADAGGGVGRRFQNVVEVVFFGMSWLKATSSS